MRKMAGYDDNDFYIKYRELALQQQDNFNFANKLHYSHHARRTVKGSDTFRNSSMKHKTLQQRAPELYKELKRTVIKQDSPHVFMSEDGKYIYHVGIIDYLQDYDSSKRIEHWYKSMIDDGNAISCVPPKKYVQRFFNFMQSQVIVNMDVWDGSRQDIKLKESLR